MTRSRSGVKRALNLVKTIEQVRTGSIPTELIEELDAIDDGNKFAKRCEAFGIFTNFHTLEVDLFKDKKFTEHIIKTLREQKFGRERKSWIDEWEADHKSLDIEKYLTLIETIGKGRFAERLASRVIEIDPP